MEIPQNSMCNLLLLQGQGGCTHLFPQTPRPNFPISRPGFWDQAAYPHFCDTKSPLHIESLVFGRPCLFGRLFGQVRRLPELSERLVYFARGLSEHQLFTKGTDWVYNAFIIFNIYIYNYIYIYIYIYLPRILHQYLQHVWVAVRPACLRPKRESCKAASGERGGRGLAEGCVFPSGHVVPGESPPSSNGIGGGGISTPGDLHLGFHFPFRGED